MLCCASFIAEVWYDMIYYSVFSSNEEIQTNFCSLTFYWRIFVRWVTFTSQAAAHLVHKTDMNWVWKTNPVKTVFYQQATSYMFHWTANKLFNLTSVAWNFVIPWGARREYPHFLLYHQGSPTPLCKKQGFPRYTQWNDNFIAGGIPSMHLIPLILVFYQFWDMRYLAIRLE